VIGSKTEVRWIGFGKATTIGSGAGKDTTAGDMTPGNSHSVTGVANAGRQDCVTRQTVRSLQLTGIDIGSTRVASAVDQELGPRIPEEPRQGRGVVVIDIAPTTGAKWYRLFRQRPDERLADVA
jgi:hypothetical protein